MSGKPGWEFVSNTFSLKGVPPTYPKPHQVTPPPPQEAAESKEEKAVEEKMEVVEEKCDILADAMKMTELEVDEGKSPKVEKMSVETQEKSSENKVGENSVENEEKSPKEEGQIDVSASLLNRADDRYNKTYRRKCIADALLKHR